MHIDAAVLTPASLFFGALIGACASLCGAVYTQRCQDRLQRIAGEVAKREAVYADFVMSASNLLLHAFTHDDISPSGDEQRLIKAYQPNEALRFAECGLRSRGGAQSHGRDRAEAEHRVPATRETGVVREPRTRPASGVQRDLPGGFGSRASDGRVMDAAHHLVLLAGALGLLSVFSHECLRCRRPASARARLLKSDIIRRLSARAPGGP